MLPLDSSIIIIASDRVKLSQAATADHRLARGEHLFYVFRFLATECAHEWNRIRGHGDNRQIDSTEARGCRII